MSLNWTQRVTVPLIGLMVLVAAACSDDGSVVTSGVTQGTAVNSLTSSTTLGLITTTSTTSPLLPYDPSGSTTSQPEMSDVEELLRPPIVRDLEPVLTRIGVEGDVELEVMYEPSFFFFLAKQPFPAPREDSPIASFVLFESLHFGELPSRAPTVQLFVGEGSAISPTSSVLLIEDDHHRTTRLIFGVDEELDASGLLGLPEQTLTIVLGLDDTTVENSFLWRLPLDIPAHIAEMLGDD